MVAVLSQARAGGGRRHAAGAPVGVHVRRPQHRLRGDARLPVRGGAAAGVSPGAPCPLMSKQTWLMRQHAAAFCALLALWAAVSLTKVSGSSGEVQ